MRLVGLVAVGVGAGVVEGGVVVEVILVAAVAVGKSKQLLLAQAIHPSVSESVLDLLLALISLTCNQDKPVDAEVSTPVGLVAIG